MHNNDIFLGLARKHLINQINCVRLNFRLLKSILSKGIAWISNSGKKDDSCFPEKCAKNNRKWAYSSFFLSGTFGKVRKWACGRFKMAHSLNFEWCGGTCAIFFAQRGRNLCFSQSILNFSLHQLSSMLVFETMKIFYQLKHCSRQCTIKK